MIYYFQLTKNIHKTLIFESLSVSLSFQKTKKHLKFLMLTILASHYLVLEYANYVELIAPTLK